MVQTIISTNICIQEEPSTSPYINVNDTLQGGREAKQEGQQTELNIMQTWGCDFVCMLHSILNYSHIDLFHF